jgi:hypothetical protein
MLSAIRFGKFFIPRIAGRRRTGNFDRVQSRYSLKPCHRDYFAKFFAVAHRNPTCFVVRPRASITIFRDPADGVSFSSGNWTWKIPWRPVTGNGTASLMGSRSEKTEPAGVALDQRERSIIGIEEAMLVYKNGAEDFPAIS